MGYINSIAYFQREIDAILHAVSAWARVYIDDIVCRTTSVSDLFQKLRVLCEIFVAYNISIKPTKTYLNYPDVGLLGQQDNCLGLTTSDDKHGAIQLLCYPKTLGGLKYYLRLTGYLRSYLHFYAKLAELLQSLKTLLLESAQLLERNVELWPRRQNCHSHPKPRKLVFWVFRKCCPDRQCWNIMTLPVIFE